MSAHPWLSRVVIAVVLSASVVFAFGETWRGGFLMDDHYFLSAIHEDGGFAQAAKDLTGNWLGFSGYAYYRPLVTTSFAIDHACFGLDARGYHLANLILHVVNALLVYLLLRRIYPAAGAVGAFAAALLFAVNPVHPNAVGWVAARSDLLVGAFTLGTLLCFQRLWDTGQRRWLVGALFAFAAALASKESGAVAIALAAIVPGRADWRTRLRGTAAGWALLGCYFILRLAVLDEGLDLHRAGGAADETVTATLRMAAVRLGEQLSAAVIPAEYAASWVRWVAIGMAAAAMGGLFRARGLQVLGFSFAVIMVGLAPVAPILRNLDSAVFEGFSRYWYLPVIGITTLAALAIGGARRGWPLPFAACLVLAVASALVSRERSDRALVRPAEIARSLAEHVATVTSDDPEDTICVLITESDASYDGIHVNPLAFTSAAMSPFVPRTVPLFPMQIPGLLEIIRRAGGHRAIRAFNVSADGSPKSVASLGVVPRWHHETTDGPFRLEPGSALDIDCGGRSQLAFDVCRVKGVRGTGVIRVSVEVEATGGGRHVHRLTKAVSTEAAAVDFDFRADPGFLLATAVHTIRVERLPDAGPERHPTPVDEDMMIAGVEITDRPVSDLLVAPVNDRPVSISDGKPATQPATGVSGELGVRWITAFGMSPPLAQLPNRLKEGISDAIWKQMVVSANFGSGWVIALPAPSDERVGIRYRFHMFRVE